MITITPRALAVMRRVTAHPRLKPTSGLRIANGDEPDKSRQVETVPGPLPGDRVLEEKGARLILGPGADAQIEGGELDAVIGPEGRVQFILRSP